MEGKRRADGGAAPSQDDHRDSVEQYRDFIVEGEIYQALDLSRRLLQVDGDHAQRADTARLLLDRLRSNRDDSSDHANALLRVLANYAASSKELTEELLSLLFFCEHRVQIIHHISKLTYQSRECVHLVVNAYIELLSSDRSLLVPILGSLADLPLVTSDKALVVDVTESLLDAASEEDVPAVVQSLLSMLVPAAAPRIVKKIRSQCNRLITTTTLSLTFDVIMRHAVAGSSVLTAILRVIRHSDPLTPFDLIFLALLLARPSENGAAVRVVTSLATKGVLNRPVVGETLQRVRDQKWHEAFPCFVRLASALLTACFNVLLSSSVSTTVQCAVDMLGYLVVYRSAAQEEALSLMMSMVSQPQRLALSTSRKRYMATAYTLCWDVAHAVASQLAHIATAHPTSLAPFAHIFLDHLYGIAASAGQSFSQGDVERPSSGYPTSTLETLCRTMVLLTNHEPGMISLLMITIQKQLVVPVGGTITGITTAHSQASSVVQVKQLMAIFLAGEMLVHAVGEKADRSSLLSWLQKLLASATVSDETTAHVVRLLGSTIIAKTLSAVDRSTSSSLLSAVFSRHGFEVKKHSVITARFQKSNSPQLGGFELLAGLSEQSAGWITSSLVFDVVTFVRAARLGEPSIGWHCLDDHTQSRSATRSIERSIRAKMDLLSVLTEAFLSTALDPSTDSDGQAERLLVCSFALPSVTEDTFTDQTLPSTLWCYTCALQLAVVTTNALAEMQHAKIVDLKQSAKSMSETVRLRKRLLNRVQVCWTLHKRLRALLDEASMRMKQPPAEEDQRSPQQCSLVAWLKLQITVIEKQLDSKSTWVPVSSTSSNLCSLGERLSLQAVSAVFEGLWKQRSSMIESGLEIELFRAFPARLLIQDTGGDESAARFASLQALVNTRDGKRTLKYLAQRLLDYSEMLDSLGDGKDDSSDVQDSAIESTRHWVLEGIRTLCSALRSVIEVCRKKQLQRVPSVRSEDDDLWEETAMEQFAKGASDVRVRWGGDRRTDATGWSADCAIIFGSLVNAMVQSTLGDVACELTDVLLALSAHTRMTSDLSRISFALLHSPFPSIQGAESAPKFIQKLPVLDPTAQTALASLLRPMPQKFHHLVFFIVGAWAIPSSLRVGLTHVAYIVECVEALVLSTSSKTSKSSTKQDSQAEKKRKRADREPDSEEGIDGWIARDGEHRVLKNLTHDTLPLFLETILACLTTAPLRAIPLPTAEFPRADVNPFTNLIGTLAVVSRCLQVFVSAEMTGFNLPQRTSLSVLRCAPTILKTIEQALQACVLWREEGSSDKLSPQVSDLAYLQCLLEAAEGVVAAVEKVAASFQERIVLTMQQNTQTPVLSTKGAEDEGKRGKSAGRWGSDLLRKTYRNQFQRRKPLSRSEAKLLPYFTHSAEKLKSHIADTSGTYRFDHDHHRVGDELSRSLQAIRMGDDQLAGVLSLLTPSDCPLDMRSLDAGGDLVDKWSRAISEDEDDQSVGGNDEEESEEVDDEDQGSQEEEDTGHAEIRLERIGIQNGSGASTKRANASVHTLVPQKKRAKTPMQVARR